MLLFTAPLMASVVLELHPHENGATSSTLCGQRNRDTRRRLEHGIHTGMEVMEFEDKEVGTENLLDWNWFGCNSIDWERSSN